MVRNKENAAAWARQRRKDLAVKHKIREYDKNRAISKKQRILSPEALEARRLKTKERVRRYRAKHKNETKQNSQNSQTSGSSEALYMERTQSENPVEILNAKSVFDVSHPVIFGDIELDTGDNLICNSAPVWFDTTENLKDLIDSADVHYSNVTANKEKRISTNERNSPQQGEISLTENPEAITLSLPMPPLLEQTTRSVTYSSEGQDQDKEVDLNSEVNAGHMMTEADAAYISVTPNNTRRRKPKKYIKLKDRPEEQRAKRREENKRNSRKFRVRQRNRKLLCPAVEETIEEIIPSCQLPPKKMKSRQKIQSVKTKKRNEQRLRRKLKASRKENQICRKRIIALKKKVQRLTEKLHEKEKPKSVKAQVKEMLSGCNVTDEVKNSLIANMALKQQVEKHYRELPTHREKSALSAGLIGSESTLKSNKVLHHFPFLNSSKKMVNTRRTLTEEQKKKEIVQYFLSDHASRLAAGKKQCKTKAKVKTQKRFLNYSLKELHAHYVKEMGNEVSYSTFCKYKPYFVEQAKGDDVESCLCILHENFDMLVKAASQEKIVTFPSGEALCYSLCCDESTESCLQRVCNACKEKKLIIDDNTEMEKKCSYYKWVTKHDTRYNTKSKSSSTARVPVKEKIECSIRELLNFIEQNKTEFMDHLLKIRHQYKETKRLRENLSKNEMLVHIDFSENYSCRYAREIQSMHFGGAKQQLSLHTGVVYFSEDRLQSFCTISANTRHDATAIFAHLKPILTDLIEKNKDIDTIHFKSDGPSTQYKNKTLFGIISKTIPDHFPQIKSITWNYSESYHGKGAPDGIGATIKRTADNLVSLNNDLQNFDTFFTHLEQRIEKVQLMKISETDIIEADQCWRNEQPFQGTLNVRQVTWSRSHRNILQMNSLSCFDCVAGSECKHYSLGKLIPDFHPQNLTEQNPLDPGPGSEDESDLPSSSFARVEPGNFPKASDWVAVSQKGFPYLGQVRKVLKTVVHIHVLEQIDTTQFIEKEESQMKLQKRDLQFVLHDPPEEMDDKVYHCQAWPQLKAALLGGT